MNIRFSAAMLILAGCTGMGFSAASNHKNKIHLIQGFLSVIDRTIEEITYRVTPLPELCRLAAEESFVFRNALFSFADTLDSQIAPNPSACMESLLCNISIPCQEFLLCLKDLAQSLGSYNLQGQLRQLEGLRCKWAKTLAALEEDAAMKVRYFRVMGICAGSALAILLV